jgi:hypothetical protein
LYYLFKLIANNSAITLQSTLQGVFDLATAPAAAFASALAAAAAAVAEAADSSHRLCGYWGL